MPVFDRLLHVQPRWRTLTAPLVLLGILAIAAWLRLVDLGYSELQGDEIKALARLSTGESLWEFLLRQRRPPGHWLITYTYSLFDPQLSNHFLLRLPFALAGVMSVLVCYLLTKMYFGGVVAAVAASLMAANGIFVAFGRIVQYQSFTILFLLCSLYFLSLAVKKERWKLYGLYLGTLSGGLALLAHFDATSLILPSALLLYWWYQQYRSINSHGRTEKFHFIFAIALFLLLVCSFFVPFFSSLTDHQLNYWSKRAEKSPSGLLDVFIVYNTQITVVFYSIFIVAALASIRKNASFLFLAFWILPPLVVFEVIMSSPGTHVYVYLLPLFIVIGLGFESLRGAIGSRFFKVRQVIATGIVVAGLSWSVAASHLLLVDHEPEFPWNDKQVLGIRMEGGWRRTPMMGFPYRRDWPVISEVLANLPDLDDARFLTNERLVIARFYLQDTIREFAREDVHAPPDALYLIAIEGAQSWSKNLLGRSLDYWRSREDLQRVAINDRAEIILLHGDDLPELRTR